jgi:hypothetical protein
MLGQMVWASKPLTSLDSVKESTLSHLCNKACLEKKIMKEDGNEPPKRSDVGYKRPPPEHRFQKGQKRPPRKKKQVEKTSPRDLLWGILQEERRVMVDGKSKWMTNSEIIMNNAFLLAEKGSAVMQRLVSELLIGPAGDGDDDEAMRVIVNPDGFTWEEAVRSWGLSPE